MNDDSAGSRGARVSACAAVARALLWTSAALIAWTQALYALFLALLARVRAPHGRAAPAAPPGGASGAGPGAPLGGASGAGPGAPLGGASVAGPAAPLGGASVAGPAAPPVISLVIAAHREAAVI